MLTIPLDWLTSDFSNWGIPTPKRFPTFPSWFVWMSPKTTLYIRARTHTHTHTHKKKKNTHARAHTHIHTHTHTHTHLSSALFRGVYFSCEVCLGGWTAPIYSYCLFKMNGIVWNQITLYISMCISVRDNYYPLIYNFQCQETMTKRVF